MLFLYIALGVISVPIVWITIDIIIALKQKPIPDLPDKPLDSRGLSIIYSYLTEPENIPKGVILDEDYIIKQLAPSIKYINKRYDCADFRCQLLFRLYKDCNDALTPKVKELIKKTFLDFKYNMDEPGEDSMCFWSENHQILFAVSEFLAGQEWPNEVFTNSGLTSEQHKEKALKIINIWMEQKYKYGFFEWLSNNYYAENLAPMANYIEYSKDTDSVEKMKLILDLIWFDVATHSVNNTFVAASSRMYGDNKSSDMHGNRIRTAMSAIWGKIDTQNVVYTKSEIEKQMLYGVVDLETTIKLVGIDAQIMQNYVAMHKKGLYKIPQVIYDIALDTEPTVIKLSSGLTTAEMEKEGLIGQDYNQIMAQLGSESVTNKEVIENTLNFLSRTKMYRNKFVNPFKFINIKLLRLLKVPRFLSSKFNLMTNGIALGRGDIYSYRNKHYCLTTAMAQEVNMCGAQAHIWSANISPDLAVYTTHPARNDDSKEKHSSSPGYWVGNGRQPMSVQEENVNITIYKMPTKKRLLEFHIADITHAYLPKEKFDKLQIEDNYIFGKKGKVLLAMITNGVMEYSPYDSYAASVLCQHDAQMAKISEINLEQEFDLVRIGGKYHTYVTELSDTDCESFNDFKARIKNNIIESDGGVVKYKTKGKLLQASYNKTFLIDGEKQGFNYRRFDSKYCVAERKSDIFTFSHNDKKWLLDYKKNIRMEIKD